MKLVRLGYSGCNAALNKASAFYSRGGARVWALGLVEAMNYKSRNLLKLVGTDD